MGECIFCRSTVGPFTTREHILPESLGGRDWAILPAGLFCDACQNRFGSSIEQQALGDYPFSLFRVFLGIPTKKGKAPWLQSWEGILRGSLVPGTVGYDPASEFIAAAESGEKSQIRVIAHPLKPAFVCRTLLKMGLQVVAADDAQAALAPKFDAARRFALTGEKDSSWWYLQHEDISAASSYFTAGVIASEWMENVSLRTVEVGEEGNRAEAFHLKLLYLDLLVPLEPRVQPPQLDSLPEPEYRLFSV
jgi:HNH endonuclease